MNNIWGKAITESVDLELELRTHIRGLLHQYTLTHLTTNYVTWTQQSVESLLSECLYFAPLIGPTSVSLPVEPLEILSQRWELPKLNIYEEPWQVKDSEVLLYLKHQISLLHRPARALEQRWSNDADGDYDDLVLERPLSPMLTTRGRRDTPKLGQQLYVARLPRKSEQLLQLYGIGQIEGVVYQEASVNTDDALGNKLGIDADTHQAVLSLMKSVPSMSPRTDPTSTTWKFDTFLRDETPPPDFPEPEMPPIFPRDRRPGRQFEQQCDGGTRIGAALEAIVNLQESWLTPVDVKEEDEEDLADEHLTLVDGWHALKAPSSPLTAGTPSLADSSSDVNDVFAPISSDVVLEEDFLEYQIPRSKSIGGARFESVSPGKGNSLSAFLPPLLQHTSQLVRPKTVLSPRSEPSSPHIAITASMLGEPPSITDNTFLCGRSVRPSPDDAPSSDDSLACATKTIERACGDGLDNDDFVKLILMDTLGEQDGALMEVSSMPPPNEHIIARDFPSRPADLLALAKHGHQVASGEKTTTHQRRVFGFLKKVKGLQPLLIELSWIPFKYGRTVPTDEEVADVTNDPCPQLSQGIELPHDEIVSRLAALLDESMVFSSQPVASNAIPSTMVWWDDEPYTPVSCDLEFTNPSLLTLTRGDRRRLAGLPPLKDCADESDDETSDDNEGAQLSGAGPSVDLSHLERPTKRVRFQDADEFDATAPVVAVDYPMDFDFDDSGVFLVDPDLPLHDEEHGSFVNLGYYAEGFEGSDAETNWFPDMHPVHYGDYGFDPSFQEYISGLSTPLGIASPVSFLSPHDDLLATTNSTNATHSAVTEATAADPSGFAFDHDPRTTTVAPAATRFPSGVSNLSSLPDIIFLESPHQPQVPRSTVQTDIFQDTPFTAANPSELSIRQPLAQFLAFCGKSSLVVPTFASLLESPPGDNEGQALAVPYEGAPLPSILQDTPTQLLDDCTLLLPDGYEPPTAKHRYMASLGLIQKRALVRTLSSYCAVDLVERENFNMEDTQLVLDCDTTVLFISLETLPARGETLTTLVSRLSWSYPHLLIVFECYFSSWGYKRDIEFTDKPVASVWSPPIVKAVAKLRRDLSISEGLQTKCASTSVHYAFASTVEEAAAFARIYGDAAKRRDQTGSALWGERAWLTHDEHDGEYDLCSVDGMNPFAASVLLSQITLEDFLEKTAEERMLEYGNLVGADRITRFNVEMTRRLEAMQLPPSSPINVEPSSSLNSVPYIGDSD